MRDGTRGAFFAEVYRVVALVPAGKVATYGQISNMLGYRRRARIVGWAMRGATAAHGLPCHRVVNRFGEMSPDWVFGGTSVQRDLLEAEGVVFLPSGKVDMERCLWDGDAYFEAIAFDDHSAVDIGSKDLGTRYLESFKHRL